MPHALWLECSRICIDRRGQLGIPQIGVDQGFQHLLSSKFQISGDASASAGPVGRGHVPAGTDWKLNTEILTYSRSRSLFAGITIGWRCG